MMYFLFLLILANIAIFLHGLDTQTTFSAILLLAKVIIFLITWVLLTFCFYHQT